MRRSLQALAYCHGRGIAHGALGPSSLLLSTYEDRKSSQLMVKLDNFGFARQAGEPWRTELGFCPLPAEQLPAEQYGLQETLALRLT